MTGRTLKDIRYLKQLNQSNLAELLDKSQSTIAYYEADKVTIPDSVQRQVKSLLLSFGLTEEQVKEFII